MTQAIPASALVNVTPGVLSAGGTALEMNGLLLDNSTRVPIGSVLSFPSATAVSEYFGVSSDIAELAPYYFNGFDNSNIKPGELLIAQYNEDDVGAYLRGGDISGLTLTQLQAIPAGVLVVTIDGVVKTSSSINLSSATSFSDAAEKISVGLNTPGPSQASLTGAIAGTTLTVSAVSSGTIAVGQELKGVGITAGTLISALGTGTGGTGTYTVSISQSIASEAMTTNTPVCTYDSVAGAFLVVSATTGDSSTISFGSGTISASLLLTEATGAVTSQGADATTPSAAMTAYKAATQNWATFATAFDPDNPGNANKLLFADWANDQNNRYVYVGWDTDITPTQSTDAASSLGKILQGNNSSGTICVYSPTQGPAVAMFVMGTAASIDFTQINGRITFAYRSQTGLAPDVTTETAAANLLANGYNFYGRYATAADQFINFQNGSISGPFFWADSFINQIWLTNQLQLALMVLLTTARSIPYTSPGYAMIKAACQDVIDQGLTFGAFRAGVTLSQSQIAQVNSSAGVRISDTLYEQGWYLQVRDALPQVRAARGSPPVTFWYMDGQSVQTINLAAINVQ